jgi:parvulin-like peptidyl-prolyl isomerase
MGGGNSSPNTKIRGKQETVVSKEKMLAPVKSLERNRREGVMRISLRVAALVLSIGCLPGMAQMASSHTPATTAAAPGAPASTASIPTDRPVARVNGVVLTDRDLMREMYAIFPYARQHNGGFPQAMEADIRKGALKMIEFEELVHQEAVRRGMTVEPVKVDRALAKFKEQFSSPDDYKGYLDAECKGSVRVLRLRITRSLLIEEVLIEQVKNKSVVTVAEAKAYYQANLDSFRTPESYAIQTISILPPPSSKGTALNSTQLKEIRKRAEDALKQVKATNNYETFGMLAEKISEDDYRVMMGDRRALDKARVPPDVLRVVEKMQPGQVSDLVPLEQGYTIIRLNAHNAPGQSSFDSVKDSLRNQLKQQKSEQLRVALDQRLRKTAKVEEL